MQTAHKVYRYRWVVLGVYMFVSALTQLYWLNFAAIETYLEDTFRIPAGEVMWLTLVFPLMQVVLTLPAGLLIDRKGYKIGIGLGAVFTGGFALLRLASPGSFTILLLSQIGISIGQPFVLNGITKLAVTWFPRREEATAVGLGSLALFIGMMVALGLTPWLVESAGFEAMLWVYAAAGVLGAGAFLVLAPAAPPSPVRPLKSEEPLTNWAAIGHILKMRDFVILGFIALAGIGVFNGLATWLEKILNELHGIPMTDAGTISAVLVFAGMLGCIAVPILSDRIRRRKPFLVLTATFGGAGLLVLMFVDGFGLQLANAVLLGFFLISALPILLTMSAEITGERFAGVSVGYLQLLGNLAAVILVAVMERLDRSTGSFLVPLGLLAALLAGALILALVIHESHPDRAAPR